METQERDSIIKAIMNRYESLKPLYDEMIDNKDTVVMNLLADVLETDGFDLEESDVLLTIAQTKGLYYY